MKILYEDRYFGLREVAAGALGDDVPWKSALRAFVSEWCDSRDFIEVRTSGSTGMPKLIRLPKKAMAASARLTNAFFDISRDSVLMLSLPLSYIAGKMMVVRAFEAGAVLLPESPSSLPLSSLHTKVKLGALVPLQVEDILSSEESHRFEKVENLLIGGGPLARTTRERLADIPTRFFATYGMTETASHTALMRLNGEGASACFEALEGVRFRRDESGCLCIYAPHIRESEFCTRDMVELVDERHFVWKGRLDYVINSGGIKFSPEELEDLVFREMKVPFYISSLPDKRLGERIVMVVEDMEWSPEKRRKMDAVFRRLLPRHAIPREIIYRERIPRTKSGKLIRSRKNIDSYPPLLICTLRDNKPPMPTLTESQVDLTGHLGRPNRAIRTT